MSEPIKISYQAPEATLESVEGRSMTFSDGSTLQIPRGVRVKPFGEGLLVWDFEGKGRAGRIARGRKRSDCVSFLDYVCGKER